MSSATVGKLASGIAGMTGAGSLGVTMTALIRLASAHTVPAGTWVALALLSATFSVLAGLGLVLAHERAKLMIEAQVGTARSRADLERERLAVYRGLIERSAAVAGNAASYRDLVLADALHLAVEQNGVQPTDRTHGLLYQPHSEADPQGEPSQG